VFHFSTCPQLLSSFWADEENARGAGRNLHQIPMCNQSFGSAVAWTAASIVLCIGYSEACWQMGQLFERTLTICWKMKHQCRSYAVYHIYTVHIIVVVLGLELSSRTNLESLALALRVKSLVLAVRSLASWPCDLSDLHVYCITATVVMT